MGLSNTATRAVGKVMLGNTGRNWPPLPPLHEYDGLRWAVSQYLRHYHAERPHQGLGGSLIECDGRSLSTEGEVRCRKRVGGMLRFYYREAA